ncbi:MAG: Cullin protein neddylation domain-containing protein, partial [Olpidium bornovanus]
MVILLLFNKTDSLSYKVRVKLRFASHGQIQEETEISDADLRRNLQSLACAKYKVLVKEPKGREVSEGDTFSFNSAFQSPLARLKIQTVASRPETEAEIRDTRDRVDEARKHMVEAAIVRVMKARKTMDHNNLVAEVTRQLQARFQPNPAMIKKRIEALIEREYLERQLADRSVL